MSEERRLQQVLAESAQGLVREVAERIGASGIKEALTEIEDTVRNKELTSDVTSAVPLTDEERGAIESRLRDRYGNGLQIAYGVDPAILGGLIVRVGDRYVDGSVAARLAQLRQSLTGAGG